MRRRITFIFEWYDARPEIEQSLHGDAVALQACREIVGALSPDHHLDWELAQCAGTQIENSVAS